MNTNTQTNPPAKLVWVYEEGRGQDPQQFEMLADAYGAEVQWPEKAKAKHEVDMVWSFLAAAFAIFWLIPAVMWAFPTRRKACLWLAVLTGLVVVVVGQAASGTLTIAPITLPGGGTSPEMTASWESGSGQISVTHSISNGGSGSNIYVGHAQLMPGTSQAPFAGGYLYRRWAGNGGLDIGVSPVTGLTNGATYTFLIAVTDWTNTVVGSTGANITVAVGYSITFTIPANNTNRVIHYQFIQDGEVIGSTETSPGEAQSTYTISGLEAGSQVVMQEVLTNANIEEDPLNPGQYIVTSYEVTGVRDVANGTPQVGGATGSTPLPPGPGQGTSTPTTPAPSPTPVDPVTPVAPTDPVTPPTPTGPVTGHIPVSDPFSGGEESDTDAATTGDVARSANAIVEAVNATGQAVTDAANGIVDAINDSAASNNEGQNGIIEAVNGVKTAIADSGNGIIDAVNKSAQATKDGSDAILSAIKSLKGQLANSEADAGGAAAPTGLTDPTGQSPIWEPGDYNIATQLANKLPVAPTIDTEVSNVSEVHIMFEIPVPGGSPIEVDKTIDFAEEPYATPVSLFRSMCLIMVTLTFYLLTFYTVRAAFTTSK